MKVQKDNIIKEVNEESLLANYIAAGWKPFEEKKIEEKPVVKAKSNLFVKGKK